MRPHLSPGAAGSLILYSIIDKAVYVLLILNSNSASVYQHRAMNLLRTRERANLMTGRGIDTRKQKRIGNNQEERYCGRKWTKKNGDRFGPERFTPVEAPLFLLFQDLGGVLFKRLLYLPHLHI